MVYVVNVRTLDCKQVSQSYSIHDPDTCSPTKLILYCIIFLQACIYFPLNICPFLRYRRSLTLFRVLHIVILG